MSQRGHYHFVRDIPGDSYEGMIVRCDLCNEEFRVGDPIEEVCPQCQAQLTPCSDPECKGLVTFT